MSNIWHQLPKPIFCLAPMEDVTDTVFRQLLTEIGKPPLMFSEFVNVQLIYSHATSYQRLEYTPAERPLILQIWGQEPELYYNTVKLAVELGYDGVDINMGCPQNKIVKTGGCAALINDPPLASELITAALEGADGQIPISVKTRIGYHQIETESWIGHLLQHPITALTIHGRTATEMSKVDAHWDEIGKAVTIRDQMQSSTLILGNGDVESLSDAQAKVAEYGVDGVMIGRGIFHNPWLFSPDQRPRSKQEKLATLLRHLELWEQTWDGNAHFDKLKRFFKIYVQGFSKAQAVRESLMTTTSTSEVREIVRAAQVL